MIIERRITFVIGDDGFAVWKLTRLKTLAGYFRSVIILQNITTTEASNSEHSLKVMSLGCKENDLCQLWIEGSDAELACMVLTDFIADQFEIVNTSHKRSENYSNSIIKNHPTFHLPFSLNYYFEAIEVDDDIGKSILMSKISTIFNKVMAQSLLAAMLKREKISSTGIGNGIAIPHIMIEGITKPAIVVLRLDKPVDWHCNRGKITLIIAMLIPAPASLKVVKAFTQISRALLDPVNCNFLTSTIEPEAIKAIVLHIMARNNRTL
ncbi:MAG: PTS system nitrogen regulatory IIA component [Psychromonas sp.]|jgi:PTS system nitrogen regulatory IIA component|uniref:PTS sugar transporter subunit IIA n=1 Tax=Psychromonas sp. TaxID=1884585 RepID=UPI0039E36B1E